jgi:hypothetical protein
MLISADRSAKGFFSCISILQVYLPVYGYGPFPVSAFFTPHKSWLADSKTQIGVSACALEGFSFPTQLEMWWLA